MRAVVRGDGCNTINTSKRPPRECEFLGNQTKKKLRYIVKKKLKLKFLIAFLNKLLLIKSLHVSKKINIHNLFVLKIAIKYNIIDYKWNFYFYRFFFLLIYTLLGIFNRVFILIFIKTHLIKLLYQYQPDFIKKSFILMSTKSYLTYIIKKIYLININIFGEITYDAVR